MVELQKTYSLKAGEIKKKWFLIDAEGKVLGRLASDIAMILRGKNKPEYTPYLDMGDNVIVINVDKISLTGKKGETKKYFRHSQYPGGISFLNIKKVKVERPAFVLEHAVKCMLPKNRLGRKILKNLKVYSGAEHPHKAQNPETLNI